MKVKAVSIVFLLPASAFKWLCAFALLIPVFTGFSQISNPYSRYGLGNIESPVFSSNKGMGELAAPFASGSNINYANPASYAFLTRTTVQIGVNVEGKNILSRDSSYKAGGGSVSHFVICFVPNPKHNNWAVTAGVVPFSTVGYNFAQAYNDPALGPYYQAYTGNGSLYNVFAGGAFRANGFSIGVNFGYIFGKLEYQKIIGFSDTAYAFNTRNITDININGFSYNIGLMYQRLLYKSKDNPDPSKPIYLTVGAYGSGGSKLATKTSVYWDRFNYDVNSNLVVIDTLKSTFAQKGKINLPYNFGIGAMFGNELFWLVGADFKYTNWSSFSTPLDNGSLTNSWQISIGGQIVPKFDDRNYLKRVEYRLGVHTGKSEYKINGSTLTETAGTFGIGLPLKRSAPYKQLGTFNLSGEFGSRGGSDNTLLRENYYRFTIGFVLNDIWFIKRKFD